MSTSGSLVIVFEGLPGCGKTTTTQLLANIFGGNYFAENKSFDSECEYLISDFEKLRLAIDCPGPSFLDRGYVSTIAHSFSWSTQKNDLSYWDILDFYLDQKKANGGLSPDLYVYIDIMVTLSIERKKRVFDAGNIWTQPKHLETIKLFYDHAFSVLDPKVPVVRIDGRGSHEDVLCDIVGCIRVFSNLRSHEG